MSTIRTTRPFTVVGGGAIGGSLAVALLEAGRPVQIIDADAAHVTAIRERGLRVTGAAGDRVGWVPAFGLDDAPAELGAVLLAVKGQATGAAMAWIAPRLAEDGFVVSMQNGLNESEIAEAIGAERTVAAFVDLFADVVEPGVVKDGGPGAMSLGECAGVPGSPRVRDLAHALRGIGEPVISDNVQGYLWAKLAFGSWSSVTALADAEMWDLVDRYRDTMRLLAGEVSAVALAEGIRLEDFDAYRAMAFAPTGTRAEQDAVFDDVVAWLQTQPKTRSGVWRDIAVRRRATEVPSHFLPVIAAAERHGIEVPALRTLLELIGRIERDEIGHDEAHIASFVPNETE
ncbi:2-dehydropantoate 2-reductase N-terminal domain-containing protein [Microbacterium sp. NPDC079995]|uniref:ketopantoate reductase family protein n=1 Tax=unclassified Microbacterium TaxID=2609290 RepID=UPI00344F4555